MIRFVEFHFPYLSFPVLKIKGFKNFLPHGVGSRKAWHHWLSIWCLKLRPLRETIWNGASMNPSEHVILRNGICLWTVFIYILQIIRAVISLSLVAPSEDILLYIVQCLENFRLVFCLFTCYQLCEVSKEAYCHHILPAWCLKSACHAQGLVANWDWVLQF